MAQIVRLTGLVLVVVLLTQGSEAQAQVRAAGAGTGVPAAGMTSMGAMNPMGAMGMPGVGMGNNMFGNPYGGMGPWGWGGVNLPLFDPFGGYLRGAADLTNAYGNYQIQSQQANVVNQDYRKAKIENKRRMFDEWLYERNNMPTYMDDKDRLLKERLRYSLNQPDAGDIQSGYALNMILENILKLPDQGLFGPDMPLRPDILTQINVTGGTKGGNAGLLKGFTKSGNKFEFPLAFTSEQFKTECEELDTQTAKLIDLAKSNKRDVGTIKLAQDASAKMQGHLRALVHELTPTQYMEAQKFINDYNNALKIFEQPNAASYFNETFAARGKNVSELVSNMGSQGLRFAPSVPGQENAYTAVHNSMANYFVATSSQGIARQPR